MCYLAVRLDSFLKRVCWEVFALNVSVGWLKKRANLSPRKLFKTNMVGRMISGNITIPHPPPHAPPTAWGGLWGTVMFQEIILTTIFIFNSLHELTLIFNFGP